MVAELIYYCVFWLNTFPACDGISKTLSPRSIVTGSHIDFNKHCKLEFGAYVQLHEEHDNTMTTRTTGAISLRPTGNAQGDYYLYSLSTGCVLNRKNNWTPLPMPQDVIDHVHTLARRAAANIALTFGHRFGDIIPDDDDDDDDADYVPGNETDNYDDEYPFDEGDDPPDEDPDDIAGVMGCLLAPGEGHIPANANVPLGPENNDGGGMIGPEPAGTCIPFYIHP